MEWEKIFEYELTTYDKIDYALAQIAMFGHMPVSDKKVFKLNDYLIQFKKPDSEGEGEKPSPETLIKLLQSAFGIEAKGKDNGS